ncbi:AbrB family transcriptional regulator (plasmid) [Alicyclobacillus fastidiosus]|uniref:AbrB family transcriptional regulator n=1 Tax=Alicyclobacillus fastidiosus TaxID=392011 RepID=A0ABY6ZQ65_9BACL|nr:AbrB family transcriptional regulator [Alicyclobacillus fastidiosus]WAH44987.1 AbrB family transcriptional regulator [Alicyclobacillus fastidiosus]
MEHVHRKVTKIGNSLGVTFNKELLNKINVGFGDELEITVNENEGEIVLRKSVAVPQGIDPRFFEVLQKNVNQYRNTIEGLKDR